MFNNPGDRLISVAFSDGSTTDTNGFYQHSMNFTNTAPACALVALEPTVECDSYITIGLDCFGLIDGTTSDPDFDSTKFNTAGQVAGGWYNSAPSTGQGTPDANGKVLIAQFSVKQNKNTSGTLTVYVKLAGSDDLTEYPLEAFDCSTASQGGGGGTSGSSGGSAPIPSSPEAQGAGGGGCPAGMIWYVDVDNIPGANSCCTAAADCTGWANACPDLQLVLDQIGAGSGDQIWVAEGTYKPTKLTVAGDNRSAAFALANCLEIYGGYPNGGGTRDPENLITTLSGDIGIPIDVSDNSYHVVVAYDVDDTAILDGFTVSGGRADGLGQGQGPFPDSNNQGSGVNIYGIPSGDPSTPQIANCTFLDNYSLSHGAVNDHGGATLTDCVFRNNDAESHGAGLYVHADIGTTVTNCKFYDNFALGILGKGGGAYVKLDTSGPEPAFTDCIFSGNQAHKGGGIYNGAGRSPSLVNCTFSGNSTSGVNNAGAGMYNDSSNPTVSNCTFDSNIATGGASAAGGGMYNLNSSPVVIDCEFIGNQAPAGPGCGGAMNNAGSNPIVTNCQFIDNLAVYGGAMYNQEDEDPNNPVQSNPTMINCKFIGNQVSSKGGALFNTDSSVVTLTNCLFSGNSAGDGGGGALFDNGLNNSGSVTNCTFSGNSTTGLFGGGSRLEGNGANTVLNNCIFWGNVRDSDGDQGGPLTDQAAQISGGVQLVATYSDIHQCASLCNDPDDHNIGVDPMFVVGPSDNWTEDGVYCSQTCWDDELCAVCGEGQGGVEVGQSKFTDVNAMYTTDEHVGKLLNVNTAQDRVALITANTETTITVWGDLTGVGGDTDSYRIDDYRLDSSAGSPCIDAADNNVVASCGLDLDGKERFFDDLATDDTGNGVAPPFVDMGAYEFGGDPELDCDGNALADSCCPADFNSDEIVNAFDLAQLLGDWGPCPDPCTPGTPDCSCRADFDLGCAVGASDLAQLLGDWGPCE